jgi:hypothetical protein
LRRVRRRGRVGTEEGYGKQAERVQRERKERRLRSLRARRAAGRLRRETGRRCRETAKQVRGLSASCTHDPAACCCPSARACCSASLPSAKATLLLTLNDTSRLFSKRSSLSRGCNHAHSPPTYHHRRCAHPAPRLPRRAHLPFPHASRWHGPFVPARFIARGRDAWKWSRAGRAVRPVLRTRVQGTQRWAAHARGTRWPSGRVTQAQASGSRLAASTATRIRFCMLTAVTASGTLPA